MESNIKIGLGVLAALVLQSAGGGYWLSQKLSPIDNHALAIERLGTRYTETTLVNIQRDIRVLNTKAEGLAADIESLQEEVRISPTFETTNAIIKKLTEVERDFDSFSEAVEEFADDEFDLEIEWERQEDRNRR